MQTLKKGVFLPVCIIISRHTPFQAQPGSGDVWGFASEARGSESRDVCAHWTPTVLAFKVIYTLKPEVAPSLEQRDLFSGTFQSL